MRRNRILYKIGLGVSLLMTLVACQKFADPEMVFEKEPESNMQKARKVLLISIDGLSGLELKKYQPANIAKILEHAKYSYEGIADANTHDAASWTTLLSGKNSVKHGVLGNSFDNEEEGDDDDIEHEGSGVSTGYVSVYQRLLESGRRLKTLSISPWEELDHNLFNLSDENGVVASDEAVKDKAVDRIKNGESSLAFTVINFRDLNAAGIAGGFSMDNANYKSTLDRIDGYVGSILTAVSERKGSENEDWLIIVTANHGGIENSYGGATLEERKIPIIFYNPNFIKQQFSTPSLVNSLVINTKTANTPSVPAANTDSYDIKDGKEYTLMCKVKNNVKPGGSSHAVILGRVTHAYAGGNGWAFMIEGAGTGRYRFYLADKNASNNQLQVLGSTAGDVGTWETLAVKIYKKEDGKRYAKFYVNGIAGTERDITTGRGSFQAPTANLFVGSGNVTSIGTFDGMVNNFVFIPKALSDQEIQSYTCMDVVNENTPFWNDVTGFWPMDDVGQKVFKNHKATALDTDFKFSNATYGWNLGAMWNCLTEEENKQFKIIYQYDILTQVYYWLNIPTADSWGLEGEVFLDQYEQEFIGK